MANNLRRRTNNDSDETLENEDPRPSGQMTRAVKFHETTSEKTTHGSGGSGGGEEDGHTETAFVALVPKTDAVGGVSEAGLSEWEYILVGDSGEETALSHAKEASHGQESSPILDEAKGNGHGAPDDHGGGDPERGAEALHDDVGWDL